MKSLRSEFEPPRRPASSGSSTTFRMLVLTALLFYAYLHCTKRRNTHPWIAVCLPIDDFCLLLLLRGHHVRASQMNSSTSFSQPASQALVQLARGLGSWSGGMQPHMDRSESRPELNNKVRCVSLLYRGKKISFHSSPGRDRQDRRRVKQRPRTPKLLLGTLMQGS